MCVWVCVCLGGWLWRMGFLFLPPPHLFGSMLHLCSQSSSCSPSGGQWFLRWVWSVRRICGGPGFSRCWECAVAYCCGRSPPQPFCPGGIVVGWMVDTLVCPILRGSFCVCVWLLPGLAWWAGFRWHNSTNNTHIAHRHTLTLTNAVSRHTKR